MIIDITTRNFFRLLRSGAFGENEQIEPMSAWKWRRVFQLSLMHDVTAVLFAGIDRCKNQFYMQMPLALMEQWKACVDKTGQHNADTNLRLTELFGIFGRKQLRPIMLGGQGLAALYDKPALRSPDDIDIFFPFETQGKKADKWGWENGTNLNDNERNVLSFLWQDVKVNHYHRIIRMTNSLHRRTLQSIVEKEFRENTPRFVTIDGMQIEALPYTLQLLQILMRISRQLLNDGILLKQFTDLGIFLRKTGDKVDFVKLQSWIDRLHFSRMCQLEGAILVNLLSFNTNEIPFMSARGKCDMQQGMSELFAARPRTEWHFQQGNDIFVHTANSSAMFWQMRHSARYFRYYPSESATNFMSTFMHSLSHIEE
jgi:hypothetical protein